MKKLNRLLAAVLTAAMLATFLPASVLAAEGDETTEPDSEAVISETLTEDQEEAPAEDLETVPAENQDEDTDESEQFAPIGLDGLDLYATVGGEKVYLEPVMSTFSLIPLEYHSYYLDLSSYFSDELKSVDISDLVNMLRGSFPSGQIAAWAKWGFYDEDGKYIGGAYDDDYTLLGDNATIDLSYGTRQSGSYQMELIVGTADQLNPNNIRCRIDVHVGYHYDLLEAEAYTTENPRQPITVYDENLNTYDSRNILYIPVEPETWPDGKEAHLGLTLGRSYSSFTAKAYAGYYETEEAIANANATEITSQIMNQSNLANEGGYQADYSWKNSYKGMPEVTLVLTRNSTGKTACVMPVTLYMYPDELNVSLNNLYVSSSQYNSAGNNRFDWDKPGFDEYLTCTLYSGYKADGTYYVELYANDPKTDRYGADAVKGAYVGNYTSIAEAEAAGQTDIKSQLFSYSNRYPVDFSQYPSGIQFTVVDINDRVWHFGIEVKARSETLPSAPTPLSADTYFRMQSALTEKDGSRYNAYVMNYADDSYYYMGYQTVFLLDGSNPVSATEITPTFYTGNKVEVFAGHDVDGATASAEKQTSEETPVAFTPGKPIQYSAAAENGKHLKNYFVTFLTQQEKPTLFVNGTNDESNYQEDPQDSAKKIPARVVNLTSDYNYRHDIFFANLGKDKLTGLKVELTGLDGTGEAENVKLDDYWTIGATKSLAGFTNTSKQAVNGTHDPYGELSNVGKIRLVPLTDENGNILSGQIKGLLTISADGVEPVRILLTCTAGTLQINTAKLLDGVKYVSYSSLVQTNYISNGSSGTDAVSFTASGLPRGISMKPNGELYGIPTVPGTYEVTITATATIDGERKTDTKTYTMTIADNKDMNVWEYDQGIWGNLDYTPAIAIPNENMDQTNIDPAVASYGTNTWSQPQQILETQPEGDYQYFINRVFIDDVLLSPGVDYTSEEGSIKLTLQTQTLKSFGNGTHTISAEARIGDKENGSLRRVAQNYTLTTLGTSRPNNGGNNGGNSGSSSGSSSSSGSTNYSITVPKIPNCTIKVSPTGASEGTRVTLTVRPNTGYVLSNLTVTGPGGKQVALTSAGDGKYTFRMPNGKVNISAEVEAEQPEPIPAEGTPFLDVRETDWFYRDVAAVYELGWMVGTSENSFSPRTQISRGMIVTILHRMAGEPAAEGTYFADVPLDRYYTTAAAWAVEQGIVTGYSDGRFGPSEPMTREQIIMSLYNYAKLNGIDTSAQSDLSRFHDLDQLSPDAQQAMSWAYWIGLIRGKGDGILDPTGATTRAEAAAFLMRFIELTEN